MKKPYLSIVTTIYYSAPYLQEFFDRVLAAASKIDANFEIIFVNDGSPDNSLEIAMTFLSSPHSVRIIDLSRNFGHHKAMMTGLAAAQGEYIFLIDCDLEEAPELLNDFHLHLRSQNNLDVVFGIRSERKNESFKGFMGSSFYKIFNLISDVKLPENLCVVRLMSKRFVDSLKRYQETEFIIGGLWQLTGFNQLKVPIERKYKGITTYSWGKQFQLLLEAIVSFTSRPLYFVFFAGLLASFAAMIMIVFTVFIKIYYRTPDSGFSMTIISIWFLGGLNLLALGTLGIYQAMIYRETKRRPLTIIRDIFEN